MKAIYCGVIFIFTSLSISAQDLKTDIHLKDGQVLSTDFIRFSNGELFGDPFIATDHLGLERIYSDKIDFINAYYQEENSTRFEVIPWRFFRIWTQVESISDRITIYNNTVINQYYMEPIAYSNNFSDRNIIAYKKDNGPINRITYRNLRNDLGDKYESKIYLNKVRNQTFVQVISYVAGAYLIGYGVRETYRQAHGEVPVSIGKISAFYLGGISGFVIPLIIRPFKRANLFQAMRAY